MTTADELIAFEKDIAELFNAGKIRAPVHLAGGNESQLLDLFRQIRYCDWITCSWRSHYHCLLKGVPPDRLREDILKGKSITLCYPEFRIYSSAIVGGSLPIAVGIAMAIKRRGADERVYAFCGDMTSRTGIYHECISYAAGHDLPICFVVEHNGISVCTNTGDAWGRSPRTRHSTSISYTYKLPWPHSGAGTRVQF